MPDPEVLARLRALIETGRADGPGPQENSVPGADDEHSVSGADDHGRGRPGVDAAAPRDSQDDPVARGHDIALRLLTVRDRTTLELRTRLARRQIPDEAIDEVLERLARVGLLDDAGFARQWVDQSSRRHVATGRLRRELRTRGVCDEDAQAALAGRDGEQDRELAEDLIARKLRSMGHLPPPTRYRRLAGLLTRRGFPASVIASVLADLPDQPGQGELGEQDA